MSYLDDEGEMNFQLSNLRIVVEYYAHLPDTDNITMYISKTYSGEYQITADHKDAHLFPDYRTARLVACMFRSRDSRERVTFIDKEWLGSEGYYWQMVSMRQLVFTLTEI